MQNMLKKIITSLVFVALLIFVSHGEKDLLLVKREKRSSVVSTEYGDISSVPLINGSFLLHFFTLDPNSLFLPVILHADMLFYVHTGSGQLSWTEDNGGDLKRTDLSRGDVYRLQEGSVFFIQSNLETQRQKLRIRAFFHNPNQKHNMLLEPLVRRPYSSIRDMVLGFHKNVLQSSFQVPEQVINELLNGTKQPAIVHGVPKTKKSFTRELEAQLIRGFFGGKSYRIFESNKKKKGGAKLFNIFNEDKDFENDNGWSTTVTRKKLSALKGSNIGLFMVNLTAGSMMGPHWNPLATEIAIVLEGRGIVQVVCPDVSNETLCRNTRFEVEVGDVFIVPRFNIMAQMAFNNDTFAFMGFTTSSKKNHPQYLAGQASVLRTLDIDVLAQSFDVSNTTILDRILAEQRDSVILKCTSCAEEILRVMQEEVEKEREEAREREEEETRKREEERRKEEEEAAERKREEEEAARKREEEEARRQEEERKKREEEEERRREEEEAAERKREEEEAARKREEEEAQRQEEERKKREEEEETRKREEEAAARTKEEEAARKREEEEAARRQEEQRKKREEEEAAAARRAAAEAAKEAEETKRREEEEAAARSAEEERQRQAQAAAKKAEEERQRQEREAEAEAEEERKMEEEAQKEEEAARQEEQERERREQGGGEGLILKKRLSV